VSAISHSQCRRLVQTSLERMLNDDERIRLESHLDTCPSCRQYAADLHHLDDRLAPLMKKRWKASPDLDQRSFRRIQIHSRRKAMRKSVLGIAGGVLVITIFILIFSGVLNGFKPHPGAFPGSGLPSQGATINPPTDTPAAKSIPAASGGCYTVSYVVKAGDALYSIAATFNVPVATLVALNGLANNNNNVTILKPGLVLYLPICLSSGTPYSPSNDSTLLIMEVYTVKSGDTCSSIAALFNTPVAALIQLNNLDSACSHLTVGQVLGIPGAPEISGTSSGSQVSGPGACTSVKGGEMGTGVFIWPTSKHFISGMDYDPKIAHLALDLAAAVGDAIDAADTGTVIYTGWNAWGYGNLVILDHGNGYHTLYAHLDVVKVSCGQNVQKGDLIGLAGMTGNSPTGPHLHFEVILNGVHINPWTVLPPP